MTIRTGLGLAAFGLAVTLVPSLTRADDEGFKPLFNGKDLSGWVAPAVQGYSRSWTARSSARRMGRSEEPVPGR